MNTKNLTTLWFIDDDAHLRQEIKDCFDIKSESAIYTNQHGKEFKISTINPGIYGNWAIDKINSIGPENGILIPDLIFLDLRYPIDKSNNETDVLKLHGMKVLEEILKNEYMKDTCVIIFSVYYIDAPTKTNILNKSKIKEREIRFAEKQKLKYDDTSLADISVKKNCSSLKHFIDKLVSTE